MVASLLHLDIDTEMLEVRAVEVTDNRTCDATMPRAAAADSRTNWIGIIEDRLVCTNASVSVARQGGALGH
jgi:hypothetical protein